MASGGSPTIRIEKIILEKLGKLDFVKKHTTSDILKVEVRPSEIIRVLILFYESNKTVFKKWEKEQKKNL